MDMDSVELHRIKQIKSSNKMIPPVGTEPSIMVGPLTLMPCMLLSELIPFSAESLRHLDP